MGSIRPTSMSAVSPLLIPSSAVPRSLGLVPQSASPSIVRGSEREDILSFLSACTGVPAEFKDSFVAARDQILQKITSWREIETQRALGLSPLKLLVDKAVSNWVQEQEVSRDYGRYVRFMTGLGKRMYQDRETFMRSVAGPQGARNTRSRFLDIERKKLRIGSIVCDARGKRQEIVGFNEDGRLIFKGGKGTFLPHDFKLVEGPKPQKSAKSLKSP